jgi:SAD/SRA domain
MIALPQNRFPTSYQGLADYLIEKFERQHWGEPPKGEKDTGAISKKSKRVRDDQDESGTIAKKPKRVSLNKNEIKQPPPNHPIFGKEGIMRGTLWYLTEGPTPRGVIALDENYERKDSKVFGHNGLKVGDWWARSLAALRDGAHGIHHPFFNNNLKLIETFFLGQRTAGVSGSLELGAYSVIISNDGKRQGGKHKGGYGGVDKDDGNTIIFSGPGAYDTKSTTADEEKHGTKCLIKSFETKNPVRVIRGETDWRRSPSVGYRYDGLYQVVEKGTGTNSKNGLYTWFKLERLKDQDEINRKVPNKEQRRLEEEVIKGY